MSHDFNPLTEVGCIYKCTNVTWSELSNWDLFSLYINPMFWRNYCCKIWKAVCGFASFRFIWLKNGLYTIDIIGWQMGNYYPVFWSFWVYWFGHMVKYCYQLVFIYLIVWLRPYDPVSLKQVLLFFLFSVHIKLWICFFV